MRAFNNSLTIDLGIQKLMKQTFIDQTVKEFS